MHITIKDILIYGTLGLGAAVAVNHYAELNVPILNKIEGAVISSTPRSPSSAYRGVSRTGDDESDCYDSSKVSGDTRAALRQQIEKAKKTGDWEQQRALEDRLAELDDRERGDCR